MPLTKVLIHIHTEKIENAKDFLNLTVAYFQELYNSFKAIGIMLSLQDMHNVSQIIKRGNTPIDYLKNFVADKLLIIAGTPDFGGVPINQAKLRELLAMPNLSSIEEVLENQPHPPFESARFEPALLEIIKDIVSKKASSDATLESRYTYYSENDKGAELATVLIGLSDNLNSSYDYIKIFKSRSAFLSTGLGIIEGLEFENEVYRPKLSFIRDIERIYGSYVA
jgi:hypothetical protein